MKNVIILCLLTAFMSYPLSASMTEEKIDTSEAIDHSSLNKRIELVEEEYSKVNANTQNIKNIKHKIDVSEMLDNNIDALRADYEQQIAVSEALTHKIDQQNEIIKTLDSKLLEINSAINLSNSAASELTIKIAKSEALIEKLEVKTAESIATLEETSGNNFNTVSEKIQHYVFVFTLAIAFILLVKAIYAWYIGRKITQSHTSLEDQNNATKQLIVNESILLDTKLIDILEKQLQIQNEQIAITDSANKSGVDSEVDHSMAIKIANEIVRMQKNILKMGDDVKGVKPLLKGLERLEKSFLANDYEIVDLLNQPYNEGYNMKVISTDIDESLSEGTKIISRIIRPQVNYNEILIQSAEVDVLMN